MIGARITQARLPLVTAGAFLISAFSVRGQDPQGYLKTPSLGIAQPAGLTPVRSKRSPVTLASAATKKDDRTSSKDSRDAWSPTREAMRKYFKRAFQGPTNLTVNLDPVDGAPVSEGRFRRIELGFEKGKVDGLEMRFAQFRLYGPRIDMARLEDSGEVMFLESPQADLRLEVEEGAMNALLASKEEELGIRDGKLDFQEGSVSFVGFYKTLFVENRVRIKGQLQLADNQVSFVPDSLHVGVLPVPQAMMSTVAGRMNPVVDMDQLQARLGLVIEVTDLMAGTDRIILSTRGAKSWRPH